MPTLFSWYLKSHGPAVLAHGIVSGHPKLKLWDGRNIHTSRVVHAEENGDGVLLNTMSGRLYRMAPEELSAEVVGPEFSLPDPAALDLPPDFWGRCIQARDRAAEREEDGLRALESPRTLRLCVVGGAVLSALWLGPDGRVRRIPTHTHIGHVQDSVLAVDFWYSPAPHRIEPYCISVGIDTILVVNKGLQTISIQAVPPGVRGQEILCPAGETTRIAVSHLSETCFQINRI